MSLPVASLRHAEIVSREHYGSTAPAQLAPNVAELMAECAEEFGFMHSASRLSNQELEEVSLEAFANSDENVAEEALRLHVKQIDAIDLDRRMQHIHSQIVKAQTFANNYALLRDLFRQYTSGSIGHDLVMLQKLVELAQTDPQLQALGYTPQALRDFVHANERAIRASIHIESAIAQFSPDNVEGKQLQGIYERAIVNAQSLLQSFSVLGKEVGVATIKEWQAFLTNAVATDLSAREIGADKEHLTILLKELKGFRVLNTILSGLDELTQKRLPPDATDVFENTVEYPEQPLSVFPNIEKWVSACTMDEQILFFQDYRNLFNRLPSEAFSTEAQKQDAKSWLQQRIDELVWSQ